MVRLPKPRWLRYSTRTLLVAVTVFCVWFAYSVNWIRERKGAIDNVKVYAPSVEPVPDFEPSYVEPRLVERPSAPGLLWLFGETGVALILVNGDNTAAKVRDLQRLFPEAFVINGDDIPVPPMAGPDGKRL